jgi:hypothetical protein
MKFFETSKYFSLKKSTYINLRWIAIIGQLITINIIYFIFSLKFNLFLEINMYEARITKYKNKAVLLLRQTLNFSEAKSDLMNIDEIHALSFFLKKMEIELYCKIHPKTDEDKIEDLIKILEIDESKLIKSRAPISDNIIIIQPKFIFGWFSSGLAESLSLNIIPVMINPITIAKKIQTGSTFDYKNRCLDFKTDQELIKSCSQNNDEYKKTLNRLKNNA